MTFKKIIAPLLLVALLAECKPKENKVNDTTTNTETKNTDGVNSNNDQANNKSLIVRTWKITGSQFEGEEMENTYPDLILKIKKDGQASLNGDINVTATYKLSGDGKSITFTLIDNRGTNIYTFDINTLTDNMLKATIGPAEEKTKSHTFTARSFE